MVYGAETPIQSNTIIRKLTSDYIACRKRILLGMSVNQKIKPLEQSSLKMTFLQFFQICKIMSLSPHTITKATIVSRNACWKGSKLIIICVLLRGDG